MNDSILTDRLEDTSPPALPRAFQTIVYGGLAVGVMDGLAACINSGIKGATPDMVFHYIASATLGRDASYNGGIPTILLGVLMHFCVAFGAATGFYALSRIIPAVLKYPFITGPLYGVFVYFFMGWLLVPMTAAPKLPFTVTGMVTGIVIHMICVGSPPAFIARRFAKAA